MIDFIEGVLAGKTPVAATVAVGGVGFLVRIPVSTYAALPEAGRKARLLTHMQVREDAITLYGFATEEERELFRMLIGVNKVGPKLALNVLSSCSVENFKRYVASEDAEALASLVKGVGVKTARRLIMELLPEIGEVEAGLPRVHLTEAAEDAVKALVSLGEKRSAARRAVGEAAKKLGPDADQQALVRGALSG